MNFGQRIEEAFDSAFQDFVQSKAITRLSSGDVTVEHYKSILQQKLHQERENPRIQVLASTFFEGNQRAQVAQFFSHATTDLGLEHLIRADLRTLGVDDGQVAQENPLPATIAVIAYCYYQIQNLDPVGYLGYLYFQKGVPSRGGPGFAQALKSVGVPDDAFEFLNKIAEADPQYEQFMENALRDLVVSEEQARTVIYMMTVSGQLYARMLEQAIDQADSPRDYGIASYRNK